MQRLFSRPAELQGRVFEQLFTTAEIAKFNTNELRDYEQSSNDYRDIKNGMDTAKEEGRKEGREEGIKKGMEVERKILIKLKEGSTDEELIKLGYTSEAIESAKETLKLILA